jgi:hypothetical protein
MTNTSKSEQQWWAVLLLVSLAAAAPRIYLGATQFIEYDGYWHVFIAMQDDWDIFWREYQDNFHPPLFYLLLKLSLLLGRSVLVYRAISILTGIAAVFLIGKIAQKVSLWRPTVAIAALAYGFAVPSIVMSIEVRAYMLCVFFVLVSLYYFLDIFEDHGQARARIGFAVFAVLAICSHYSAFFYVFACVLAAAVVDFASYRRNLPRRVLLDLATFAPVIGVARELYNSHAGQYAAVADHIKEFYFQPGGEESVIAFLLRNAHQLFNSFSPLGLESREAFLAVLAGLSFAAAWALYLMRRPLPENKRAAAVALLGALMLGAIIASAILGKYPFGGNLRHQFILFPFAVLCGCIVLDRFASAIPGRRARAVLAAAAILLTAGVLAARFYELPKSRTDIGAEHMSRFRDAFPSPASVYVDGFSLIMFFIHHHDWTWDLRAQNPSSPWIDIYRVSKGDREFLLVRDRARWNTDFAEASFYADLAGGFRLAPLRSIATFCIRQTPQPGGIETETKLARQVLELASAAGLCVKKISPVVGVSTYIEFAGDPCPQEMEALKSCQECDDKDWRIAYSGGWNRGVFQGPAHGTLTYTDQPGSVAQCNFTGTAVKWVYTKAYDRGMASVLIDGVHRGVVDLYSPDVEWQASTTFEGLPEGTHTFEIRTLDRRNPSSAGFVIDLDGLMTP